MSHTTTPPPPLPLPEPPRRPVPLRERLVRLAIPTLAAVLGCLLPPTAALAQPPAPRTSQKPVSKSIPADERALEIQSQALAAMAKADYAEAERLFREAI